MAELEQVDAEWWLCDGHPDMKPFYCAQRERLPECIPVPVYRVKVSEPAAPSQIGPTDSDASQSGPREIGIPDVIKAQR